MAMPIEREELTEPRTWLLQEQLHGIVAQERDRLRGQLTCLRGRLYPGLTEEEVKMWEEDTVRALDEAEHYLWLLR